MKKLLQLLALINLGSMIMTSITGCSLFSDLWEDKAEAENPDKIDSEEEQQAKEAAEEEQKAKAEEAFNTEEERQKAKVEARKSFLEAQRAKLAQEKPELIEKWAKLDNEQTEHDRFIETEPIYDTEGRLNLGKYYLKEDFFMEWPWAKEDIKSDIIRAEIYKQNPELPELGSYWYNHTDYEIIDADGYSQFQFRITNLNKDRGNNEPYYGVGVSNKLWVKRT